MSTTPTPEDHRRAKRVADRCRLDAAPWQLEHLAAAIAEARPENLTAVYRSGYSMGLADGRREVVLQLERRARILRGQAIAAAHSPVTDELNARAREVEAAAASVDQ